MKNSVHLVLSAILLFSPAVALAQTRTCRSVAYRKEFRTLSAAEWTRFVVAVKKLHTPQGDSGISQYDQLVKLHIDKASQIHGNAMYLPFHRMYLWVFENLLRTIDPTVTVPYWNWAYDSQSPESSPIFHPDYMGVTGTNGGCVTDGAFGGWRVLYPIPHCLQRKFNAGGRISALYSNEVLDAIISQSTNYDAFRQAIERGAASVHVGIGGDMAMMYSPNDPIYWLHIAYIDKLWDDWQQMSARYDDIKGRLYNGQTMTRYTIIPGFNTRVGDVLRTRSLCYDYEELPSAPAIKPLPLAPVTKP